MRPLCYFCNLGVSIQNYFKMNKDIFKIQMEKSKRKPPIKIPLSLFWEKAGFLQAPELEVCFSTRLLHVGWQAALSACWGSTRDREVSN